MIVDCARNDDGVRLKEPWDVAEAAVHAKQGPSFVLLTLSEPNLEELRSATLEPATFGL